MSELNVSIGIAFLAGLASFFSPCVLPLIPVYIGYLSGRTVASIQGDESPSKTMIFTHAVAFVIGFSIIFISLGIASSFIGSLLYDLQFWITKFGGIIIIIFGLHMSGLIRLKILEYDLRPQSSIHRSRSFFSSLLMGIYFSAGWSPCVGPILGAILTLALNSNTVDQGTKLLIAYSSGMAIPFLITALVIERIIKTIRRYKEAIRYVEIITGWFLVIVGILLFFDLFSRLAIIGNM